MSENKTKEEIIWGYTPSLEYPDWYHESDIQEMMQAYADQEVRKAIAWVLNNTDGRTSLDIERTVSEYINSL